ncbi:MAG: glycerol-3-phosphate acyltransferase [Planctomycetota bacterium]
MLFALGCLLSYLLGGIPFALVLVRLVQGIDVRTVGSGNVGATNASRAFGPRLRLPVFVLIYLLDFGKGLVPALLGPALFGGGVGAPVWFGACAVLGHCASPYLGLRGGKGVATTTGVVAAIEWQALLIGLLVFLAVFGLTRRVFLGSLALGLALAAAIVLRDPATAFGARLSHSLFGIVVAVFLFWTHRSNLRGLAASRGEGGPQGVRS